MKTIRIIFLSIVLSIIWSGVKAQEECNEMFFSKTVTGDFESVTEKVIAEFKKVGFGVITEIDMDQALKEKLDDVQMKPYKILGVCNPGFAYKSLQAESNIGVFLPCKVIVKQLVENKVEVVSSNPAMLMKMMKNDELDKLAKEVAKKMKTAIEKI